MDGRGHLIPKVVSTVVIAGEVSQSCATCPAGKAPYNRIFGESFFETCKSCPAGQYSDDPQSPFSCRRCDYGVIDAGGLTCTNCPVGKRRSDNNLPATCQDCPAGQYGYIYSDGAGHPIGECGSCHYRASTISNPYQPRTGQTECLACPGGTTPNSDFTACN
jgi:hypothetical protein